MFRILPETPDDAYEVEFLYDLAFAPGRTALSSYRLRDGIDPVDGLSCVARDEYDVLAGAIRYWPIRVSGDPCLLLGPIAVHPTRQGEGLGGLLVGESLERARDAGWSRVILVGDAPYYGKFGFARVPVEMPPPTNPDRVLGIALSPGALAGLTGKARRWR